MTRSDVRADKRGSPIFLRLPQESFRKATLAHVDGLTETLDKTWWQGSCRHPRKEDCQGQIDTHLPSIWYEGTVELEDMLFSTRGRGPQEINPRLFTRPSWAEHARVY